jgi:hypothetical protein
MGDSIIVCHRNSKQLVPISRRRACPDVHPVDHRSSGLNETNKERVLADILERETYVYISYLVCTSSFCVFFC